VILLFIFSGITEGADDNKEATDPALTKALVEGFSKLAEMYEKANPKDIEAYENTMSEHVVFINYLSRCLKAISIPEHFSSSSYSEPPQQFDIKIKYPLTMKTEITSRPETDTVLVLLISKETPTAPLKLFDGWIESKAGDKKKVALPSAIMQKKANDALPRLIKNKDDCRCE